MSSPFHSRADLRLLPPRPGIPSIASEGTTAHYLGDSPWGRADRSSPEAFAATTDHNRCATMVRGIQSFHMNGRNWLDIAYNGLPCPHGHLFEGRGPGRRSGANGTNDGNRRSVALCYLAGGSDPVTDAAKRAFRDGAAWLGSPLRWNHAEWKPTLCAGDPIRAWQRTGWALPNTPPPPAPTPAPPTPEDDDMAVARRDPRDGKVWIITAAGRWHANRAQLNDLVFTKIIDRTRDEAMAEWTEGRDGPNPPRWPAAHTDALDRLPILVHQVT